VRTSSGLSSSAGVRPLAAAGTVAVGALAALQARINGDLGVRLDDGFLAALLSYATGLILVAVLVLRNRASRDSVRRLVAGMHAGTVPIWWILASLAGAFAVLTQGLTVGLLGVALFGVGVVAGRTITALVIDAAGVGGGTRRRATPGRLAGAVLTVGAVVIGAAGGLAFDVPWWVVVLPVLAGGSIAFQQAANGGLVRISGSGMAAAALNFAAGTALLLMLWLGRVAYGAAPGILVPDLWLYAGGAVGVAFLVLSATLVRHVGVLILGIGVVIGQLVASVILDLVWPVASVSAPLFGVAAVAVAALAAVAAVEPWRHRRSRSDPARGVVR